MHRLLTVGEEPVTGRANADAVVVAIPLHHPIPNQAIPLPSSSFVPN